jgi:hypothetical protein
MTSEVVRYEIKTSLPDLRLENIDFEKSGSVRTQRTQQTDPDPGWCLP